MILKINISTSTYLRGIKTCLFFKLIPVGTLAFTSMQNTLNASIPNSENIQLPNSLNI